MSHPEGGRPDKQTKDGSLLKVSLLENDARHKFRTWPLILWGVLLLGVLSCALLVRHNINHWFARKMPKRGLGVHDAHSCQDLDEFTRISWYYSWGVQSSFKAPFSSCEHPDTAEKRAKNVLNLEHVPMLWNWIPDVDNLTKTEEDTLNDAKWLLVLNEPEMNGIDAETAASMWPGVMKIADKFNLKIAGPCLAGVDQIRIDWINNWTASCKAQGFECRIDVVCVHLYYFPEPCGDWGCLSAYDKDVEWFYQAFGKKPLWVSEFACNQWNSNRAQKCDDYYNAQLVQQMVPILDADPRIFRYAYYPDRNDYVDGHHNIFSGALHSSRDMYINQICSESKWLADDIQKEGVLLQPCIEAARRDPECPLLHGNLVVSVGQVSPYWCYCAQVCVDYIPMPTTWTFWLSPREFSNQTMITDIGDLYNYS